MRKSRKASYRGGGGNLIVKKGFSGMFAHILKGPGGIHLSFCTFRWGESEKKKEIFCLVTDCWSSQHIWKNRIIKVNIPVEFPFITWEIYSILIRNPMKPGSTQGKKFKSSGQRFEF